MAEYGLKVVNANGYVQIDSTFKNLGLRTKGSVTSGGQPTGSGWYPAVITVAAGSTPVIATRPSSGYAALISSAVSGGNITYTFYCSAAGITLSYWVFDDPSLGTPVGTYGLKVRNSATGATVFDSRIDYMRVLGLLTGGGDPPATIDNGFTTNFAGGTTPAVVQSELRYRWSVIPTDNQRTQVTFFAAGFSVSGSGVTLATQVVNTFSSTPDLTVNQTPLNAYGYLVLDVTNM